MTPMPEERAQAAPMEPNRSGGRPRVKATRIEVLNALSGGLTVTETARKFGISRASVYRMKDEAGE